MAGKKINILLLQSLFHLGGAEKITHEIFSRIDRGRFNVVVCTLYEPGPMGEPFIGEGFTFYSNLIGSKYNPAAFFKLNRIIREHRIDIIYLINQPLTIFWGFIGGIYNRIPVVPVIHNTPVLNEHVKLLIYRFLLPRMARVITVSEMQKKHLQKNENIPSGNFEIIHNGIDIKKCSAQNDRLEVFSELGLPVGSRVVGIVTRLVTLKGIDVFLRLASVVLDRMENIYFLIVGDGPEKRRLEGLCTELGLDGNVKFLGIRKDIARLISTFDVAVLSSRTEALPMVLLEYMANRKPVVATNVGSIPEVVENEIDGYLVESEDYQGLAERVLKLLQDSEMAESFGRRAFNKVQKYFSIEETVDRTQALIMEVVREKGREGI